MLTPSRRGFIQTSLAAAGLTEPPANPGLPAVPWIARTPRAWKARWIWDDYNRETTNIYVCLRKRVMLERAPRAADLWCTANSFYRLFINGQPVWMGPNPNEPPWKYYDYYDVGRLLRSGENAIAALCYNLGLGTHFYGAGPGGFLLQAEVELEGGRRVEIVTDSTWRTALPRWYSRYAPQMLWASGFQETFDLRREVADWTTNFTETPEKMRWGWAAEYGTPPDPPYVYMLPREIPYLRQTPAAPAKVLYVRLGSLPPDWVAREAAEHANPNVVNRMALAQERELPAGAVTGPDNLLRDDSMLTTLAPQPAGVSTRLLVDFGEEQMGYPEIDFAQMDGGVLDLGYSEALKPDGQIHLHRWVLQGDRLILGKGARRWQSYDQRTFRYLLLEAQGITGPLAIRHIRILQTTYPVEYAGRFECSDPVLNRILEVARRSTQFNMWDQYTDGPQRERGQYAGDIRTTALWNYYLFGDRLLMAKALRHFARLQGASGWFKTLSPSGTRHNIVEMMLQWVIAIWEYYWYTGDATLARELAPHAYRAIRWFDAHRAEDGLIAKAHLRDWWIFIDWGTFDFRDEVAGLNLWYHQALETAVKLARLRGDSAEAADFAARARRVAGSIERRFWNAQQGAYVDCWTPEGPSTRITRQTNYMAMLAGAAPRERWTGIVDRVTKPGIDRIRTPYFKFFELDCWLMAGRPIDAVLDEIRAWWGEQIRPGATTFWEEFDDTSPAGTVPDGSLCHSWCGGPAVILGQQILGVQPSGPGFEKVLIRPRRSALKYARGAVPTPRGKIETEWDGRRLTLTLPPCQATVGVPARTANLDGRPVAGRLEPDGYLYFDLREGGQHVVEIG